MQLKHLLTSLCLLVLMACTKEQSGLTIDYEFNSAPILISGSNGSSVLITKGIVLVDEIEFEAEMENEANEEETEIELEQSGLFTFDFIAGTITPELAPFDLKAGTYEEVEIELNLADDQPEPVVVLEGDYTNDDNQTSSFRFEYDGEEEDIEAEVENLTVPESATAMIKIDPSKWFSNITADMFNAASQDTNGVIQINKNMNTELYNKIRDKFLLALSIEIK